VPVVIKQFQFAQLGASWAEYEAFEQEIKVLRSLNHPGIPHYLDGFQTPDGFCMVQEYKNAECLATRRSFSPQEIKQIAVAVLEILVYLQGQKPPVIHRDIKPENILLDEKINVYLVDFGFARSGGGEVAASSVVKGTLGFMPPEQLFNRQLTEASDLYGLGAALICSLTGTHSGEIGNLIDDSYRIHFQHLVPPLQRGWMNWLEKMVEPKPHQRYPNAAAALLALKPVDVNSLPKVRLSKESLEFTASEFGEKVTQIIGVSNPIPDTVLAGRWEVVPHVSDPPHTPYDHAWISFQPMRFESNQAECKITVDTSRLRAGEIYSRQIILRTNSEPDTHAIDVKVQTAPLPESQKPAYLMYLLLAVVLAVSCGAGCVLGFSSPMIVVPGFIAAFAAVDQILTARAAGVEVNWVKVLVGALLGQIAGVMVFGVFSEGWDVGLLVGGVIGALGGAGSGARPDRPIVGVFALDIYGGYLGAIVGCVISALLFSPIWGWFSIVGGVIGALCGALCGAGRVYPIVRVFALGIYGGYLGVIVGGCIGALLFSTILGWFALVGGGIGAFAFTLVALGKVVMSRSNLSVWLWLGVLPSVALVFVSIFSLLADINILLPMMIAGIAAVCLFLTAASNKLIKRGFQERTAAKLPLLTAGLGVALGALYPLILHMDEYLFYPLYKGRLLSDVPHLIFITFAAVAGTGVPLIYGLISHFKRGRLIARYRRDELHLIKP
jgi:serine/threonine protein kinase